jgi:hypothetical protein
VLRAADPGPFGLCKNFVSSPLFWTSGSLPPTTDVNTLSFFCFLFVLDYVSLRDLCVCLCACLFPVTNLQYEYSWKFVRNSGKCWNISNLKGVIETAKNNIILLPVLNSYRIWRKVVRWRGFEFKYNSEMIQSHMNLSPWSSKCRQRNVRNVVGPGLVYGRRSVFLGSYESLLKHLQYKSADLSVHVYYRCVSIRGHRWASSDRDPSPTQGVVVFWSRLVRFSAAGHGRAQHLCFNCTCQLERSLYLLRRNSC